MFASLLALGSAVLYGSADFLGGLASRRAATIAVVVVSQLSGVVLLLAMLPFLPGSTPSTADIAWGAAAGVGGGVGVALLYRALAIGTMAVVAPTTAVCAVAIPVVAAFAYGERPAPITLLGMALAHVAIVRVSQEQATATAAGADAPSPSALPRGMGIALWSGVAIGFFFLFLARTSAGAGLWPLVSARITSVVLFGAMAMATGRPLRMARPVATVAMVGGGIDMLANALYLVASRYGPLSVVVTLASLYPASTVILARVVLGERLNAWQQAGIACALIAIALIVK
jgi:drug/metabolite transporter (DMT)-like permease